MKNKIHNFSILAQVDPTVNFQDKNHKNKIGADGDTGPICIPTLDPSKLKSRKRKRTKNVNFHQSQKMDIWSTFLSRLSKK